jgi:hypothetical protein
MISGTDLGISIGDSGNHVIQGNLRHQRTASRSKRSAVTKTGGIALPSTITIGGTVPGARNVISGNELRFCLTFH